MHLTRDPAALIKALKKGLPFGRSACGRVVPRAEFASESSQVDCPLCKATAPKAPVQARPMTIVQDDEAAEDRGSDEFVDLDDDMADFDENPGSDEGDNKTHPPKTTPKEEPRDQAIDDPLTLIAVTLGSLVPDDYVVIGDWYQWVTTSTALTDDDRSFIVGLCGLASSLGIETLAARLTDVLKRLSERPAPARGDLVISAEVVSILMKPEPEPEPEPDLTPEPALEPEPEPKPAPKPNRRKKT